MLKDIIPGNILFLDIETVPMTATFAECPEPLNHLWRKKAAILSNNSENDPDILWPRAGIYAEFGKVICITTAYLHQDTLRVKSFWGHDEKELLTAFAEMLHKYFNKAHHLLCAHNGKEFDFPFLARRMIVQGIILPDILDTAGQKPWQIRHLDTMELWKFGDYKSYTSLELLAAIFGIPTPKDDISGGDVSRVYWTENDLDRIVTYCKKDVLTIVNILYKYLCQPLIADEKVQYR